MKFYSYTNVDPPGSVPPQPGGVSSSASGINDKGEVVGIYFDSSHLQQNG